MGNIAQSPLGTASGVEDVSQNLHSEVDHFFDSLPDEPPRVRCSKCGSNLMYLNATFFTTGPGREMWDVPLPVCPKCDLKEDTAKFVPPCVVCGKPVQLESTKTDEHGQIIHEDCYTQRLLSVAHDTPSPQHSE